MARDLDAAVNLLFPKNGEKVWDILSSLENDRVRWAVLALSDGGMSNLEEHAEAAFRDYRDVLVGAENMSPDKKGSTVRRLPAAEALELRLLDSCIRRLGFFDRIVWSGAAVVDAPFDPVEVAAALTERAARGFGSASWREVPTETARFLLSHVMSRSFAADEVARSPVLVQEFMSIADAKRAFVSALPEELPIEPDGRPRRGAGPLNYRVGVVLFSRTRAWGLWMHHGAG